MNMETPGSVPVTFGYIWRGDDWKRMRRLWASQTRYYVFDLPLGAKKPYFRGGPWEFDSDLFRKGRFKLFLKSGLVGDWTNRWYDSSARQVRSIFKRPFEATIGWLESNTLFGKADSSYFWMLTMKNSTSLALKRVEDDNTKRRLWTLIERSWSVRGSLVRYNDRQSLRLLHTVRWMVRVRYLTRIQYVFVHR